MVVLRLGLVSQVGLGDDEAYYWLWSQRPAWAYFDHGGGVAWLIGLSTALLGDSPLGVRLPTVLAGGGFAAVVAASVPPSDRLLAAALGLFLPVFGLIGVFSAPDAPFLLVWMLAVHAATRLEHTDRPRQWIWVGACVGSTLLFKLTGVLLGLGLVLWSLASPRRRTWWGRAGLWLAIGVAVLVSAPTWGWNLLHDLPTLRFHAVERHAHTISPLLGGATALLAHVVLLSPPLIWAMWRAAREPSASAWRWMALPTWVVFSFAALLTPTKLHWWAPAWATLLPPAVRVLVARPRLAWGTVGGGAILHLVVLLGAAYPVGPLSTWTAELQGWEGLAHALVAEPAVAWVTPRYQSSAQLAWGAREVPSPPILRVTGRRDQYTMWHEDQLPSSGPVLLVCAPHLPCTPADVPALDCPEPEQPHPVRLGDGRGVRTFSVWRCTPTE